MNRILLLFAILTAISINSFGQQWTECKVDSTLTITIPDNFEITDTLGQRVITSQVDNGLILVSALENKGKTAVNVQNENELIDFYTGFQKGAINSQKGELIKEEIIEINGLKFLRFSLKPTMEDEKQIRHCLAVFAANKTYSIYFWELESMTDEMTPIRERLFSSVKLPSSLTAKDQMSYSPEGSRSYDIGYLVGEIFGYVIIFGLIIILVVWISKSVRKKSAKVQ
ncbi:hypothetical protein [Algoriphagus resistens]|uniref:hypothetical protein n=1 Tax=Algoriphagus resistens TaxID=1750590 RepID=UPI000716BC82|nr:hypothetical protein [Algoriphagus resistens]